MHSAFHVLKPIGALFATPDFVYDHIQTDSPSFVLIEISISYNV